MKSVSRAWLVACLLCVACGLQAQVPVMANPNHEQMLAGTDTKAVASKRLVHDFWREVFEREHMEFAEKDPAKKYTTTWFDMFRVENGKLAEHWDPANKQ